MMRYAEYGGYGHMGLFGGIFMFFIGLLFLGLLIYLVVLLTRSAKAHGGISGGHATLTQSYGNALNILSERYAKGEIDDEEYEKKKTALLKF